MIEESFNEMIEKMQKQIKYWKPLDLRITRFTPRGIDGRSQDDSWRITDPW